MLFPYSGPNIYSPSVAVLSGELAVPFTLSTTGHQLLLRWSSDHGTNRKGFRITYVGEYQSMYPPRLVILFSVACVSYVVRLHLSVCLSAAATCPPSVPSVPSVSPWRLSIRLSVLCLRRLMH